MVLMAVWGLVGVENIHLSVFSRTPLPSVKTLTVSIGNYGEDEVLMVSPKTTHLTVEFERTTLYSGGFDCLIGFFQTDIEHLNVIMTYTQNVEFEAYMPCLTAFVTGIALPVMKQAVNGKAKDFRLNLTYKLDIMENELITADQVKEADDMFSKCGFHRVEKEGEKKDEDVPGVEFAFSPREKIVCTVSVKANTGRKLYNVM